MMPQRCARLAALVVQLGMVGLVGIFGGRAAANPVAVKVVDVAGGAAYLTPGRAAGIVPGTRVRVRGLDTVVVEATEKTAVVRIDGARVAVGDTGTADVTPGVAHAPGERARPRPAETFVGQWPDPVPPASQQQPRTVPLGTIRRPGAAHVTVVGHALGVADRANRAGSAEARVIASFDVMRDRPLAAEVDAAGRWFSGGFDRRTHTPLFVRSAQLRYGQPSDPALAVGRLRFAATSVGMLDGGRAAARLGAIEFAAFGGLVPDPLSGKPDTGAARFGTEVIYDDPDAPWQPRVAVAAHGSTWAGQLDERRLSLAASGERGALALDGWAELESFPSGNPWHARAVEVTGAGATAQWRERGTHAGVDVSFLRPERSLRLAQALPPEWLCTIDRAGGESGACTSGDAWSSASASAGTRAGRWTVDAIGTVGYSRGQYRGFDRSGYVRGELRVDPVRLLAGIAGGQTSFASWTAGELGVVLVAPRRFDVALIYRPELLDYVASAGPELAHTVTADARVAISTALDVAFSALGSRGADRDALALLATLVWRPLP